MVAASIVACGSRRPAAPAQPAVVAEQGPFSEASLMADVKRLCGDEFAGRGSYQAGSALASQFLVDEFEALGYEVVRQKVRGRYAENIIAIKAGDDQAVMVSAHHDHLGTRQGKVYRGADDNASGVAVLLAIARSRASVDYKHTVLFVSFGAEEDGLVGSGVYIHDPYWPLKATKAMINFDMVGRNFFEAGANQEASVAVVGLEANQGAMVSAQAAALSVGLNMIAVPARLLELFGLHDRTDDWWFRRQNIPSIHFSTGLHRDYHQVSDTLEKIQPQQLSRISSMAAQVLDGLADDSGKP
jgi:Zn-dependent M28 family amino/carboxypeptidase